MKRHLARTPAAAYSRSPFRASLFCLLFGLAAVSAAVAQSSSSSDTSSAATAAQIQAAQQQGAQIGYAMQGSPVVDANGNVVINPNGSVAMTTNSSATARSNATLAQGIIGANGFQSTGQSFGGVATQTASVNIACGVASGSVSSAAGVMLMFSQCEISSNTITAIDLQICTQVTTGGLCDNAGDYSAITKLPANVYTTLNGTVYGVGCNNTIRTCQITVTTSGTSAVSAADLTAKAAAAPPNELQGAIATTVNSPTYQNEMVSQQGIVDCYSSNQTSFLQNGTVATCDKSSSASVAGGPAGNACNPTQTCTASSTSTTAYATTCTREFPVTNYTCAGTTPSKTCTDTLDRTTGVVSNSSCTPDDIANATLVGTLEGSCSAWEDITGGEKNVPNPHLPGLCTNLPETKYYVFASQSSVAASAHCTASPNPINGSFGPAVCDTTAQDVVNNCASGGWFGRTLTDQQCQASTLSKSGTATFTQYNYQTLPGCGYCVDNNISYLCQGAPTAANSADTCASSNLTGCTLTNVQVQNRQAGVTLSQLETYSCSSTVSSCTAWTTTNNCATADASYGVAAMPVKTGNSNGAFSQAVATSAVLDTVAQSVEGSANTPGVPLRLFPGDNERCREPLGFVSGLLSTNCCKTSLTKTGGALVDGCNQQEVTLAAARRAKYTTYIGEYCSSKIKFLFFSSCVQNTQVYCAFQGVLPRIIQVQGRQQLAALATSTLGAALQTRTFNFPYYAGTGGWQSVVTVNGVQVSTFQQPTYCTDPTTAANALSGNLNAAPCSPNLDVWFASCENSAGCGTLPADPADGSEAGTWVITPVDPLNIVSTTISDHAIAQGACDTSTQQCSYKVSAWPAGAAGAVFVTQNVSFGLYTTPVITGSASLAVVGNTAFRPVGTAKPGIAAVNTISGPLPASVPAQVSADGGLTWTTFALPTQIKSAFSLPNSNVTVSGGCSSAAAMCDYTLTGSVEVTAKPWGSVSKPDCSGFTLTQFSELNIGKMDLSEWTATIQTKILPNTSTFATQATAQAQANQTNGSNPQLQSGPVGGITPMTAAVSPLQALGPFTAQLTVSSNWPAAGILPNDPISSVEIDWGDCSGASAASAQPSGGYAAQHLYRAPNTAGMCDSNGAANPLSPRNLNEVIKLTIRSSSGTHAYQLNVINAWQDFQSTNGPGSASTTGP